MASVSKVRAVLAQRLETVEGLRVHRFTSGSISPPAAAILPGIGAENSTVRPAIDYDKSFGRGMHMLNFLVRVAVSSAHSEAGQDALDAYLDTEGEKSIKEAIEAGMDALVIDDEQVGAQAHLRSVIHYGLLEWGGVDYLGATFHVEVRAS